MAKTPKTVALGGALRTARQNKDITLRDFAARMGFDLGMLSRWETGLRTPKPEQVAQILATLGVAGERYTEIMTLARDTTRDQWVATSLPEQRQQMAAFIEYEQNAAIITAMAPLLIPGLLQTTEYMRAILSTGDGVPATEIEPRVALRVSRKQVLLRPIPAQYTAVIGQGALYQRIGGPEVHIQQLRYLLMLGRRANVELRIVPFEAGWHPGLDGSFHVLSGVTLIPSVFIETRRSVLWLHKSEDVNAYKRAAQDALQAAMSADTSMRFLAALVQRMETRIDHLAQVDP